MKLMSCLKSVALTMFLSVLVPFATTAESRYPDVVGRASVVDGDTIDVQGVRIRFHGIDAPESYQSCETAEGVSYRCGREIADRLSDFLAASRPVRCVILEPERGRDRWIGTCYRADGTNVNSWLVAEGFALDWPKYSGGVYRAAQDDAEQHRAGIWSGRFENPCIVRAVRAKRTPNC